MVNSILKLLKVLNSEAEPGQISLALCFGMIAGFLPFFSVANLIILLIVLLVRVNLSAFILATAFFSGVAYVLDPVFNRIGLVVLTASPLQGLWTAMYNSTFWRLQKFNNSVVMGSFLCSLAAFVPAVLLFNVLIRKYRERVLTWIKRTKIVQALTASRWYEMYRSLS
jgi:uncharacterized protein (TIGR03546 family)